MEASHSLNPWILADQPKEITDRTLLLLIFQHRCHPKYNCYQSVSASFSRANKETWDCLVNDSKLEQLKTYVATPVLTTFADTTFCFSIHLQSHRARCTQMFCAYYRSLVLHWCRSTGAENKLGKERLGGRRQHIPEHHLEAQECYSIYCSQYCKMHSHAHSPTEPITTPYPQFSGKKW